MVHDEKKIVAAFGQREKNTVPVTFMNEQGETIFVSQFDLDDFYPDALHVRLLQGNFLRHYRFIDAFFTGLALHLGKKRVTFCTVRRAVKKFGDKMGYGLNSFGDLEKAVA